MRWLESTIIDMAKCPSCKSEEELENCGDCKGTGNAANGSGYCPFCNGERKICKKCQF